MRQRTPDPSRKATIVTADFVDIPDAAMPAAFFAHGHPRTALGVTRSPSGGKAFGESGPRPRPPLGVSPHW